MEIPIKKLNSGFSIPTFGLGTWRMGGDRKRDLFNDDKGQIAAIRRAIDAGITHIDTAELYAEGHSEELVGEAIKQYDREKLCIVSKVLPIHLHYDDVITALNNSLKRLQTHYLDLYLIHQPNNDIPIGETLRAFDYLKKEGKIKNIGVSNFTPKRLEEAQKHTTNKIVANQVHYNLMYREPERTGLVQYCQDHDVIIVAWRPVENVIMTAKDIEILNQMCEKYKKTPAQIAINWLISQPNVVAISKMTKEEHLQENLGSVGWEMDEKDIKKLRSDFPNQQDISNAVRLQ